MMGFWVLIQIGLGHSACSLLKILTTLVTSVLLWYFSVLLKCRDDQMVLRSGHSLFHQTWVQIQLVTKLFLCVRFSFIQFY